MNERDHEIMSCVSASVARRLRNEAAKVKLQIAEQDCSTRGSHQLVIPSNASRDPEQILTATHGN